MFSVIWLCFFVSIVNISYGQFEIPPVSLEAYQPTGFRASIKAEPGVELFGFHGKLNEEIKQIEPGEFSEDVKVPTKGYFIYFNPNLRLTVGDVVNYWIFVQHNQLGYRKDAQKWTVTELKTQPRAGCEQSITKISGRQKVCRNVTIFEDQFDAENLDTAHWTLEQYVPGAPDYEFVVYKKDTDVTFLSNNLLNVRPKAMSEKEMDEAVLDLSAGCTKPDLKSDECVHKKYLMQNPFVSGRLVSKLAFSYADVEIQAKLPCGDWIYPEIYLEDEHHNKLVIAYARGNRVLTGNDNVDIGGSMLFGGPMLSQVEPKRSQKLSSFRSDAGPFCDQFHTYRLRWSESGLELYVDGRNYGVVSAEAITPSGFVGSSPKQVHLVLGVGVGGITDFPDGYKSGTFPKPWRNRKTTQVRTFYASRDNWLPTWVNGGVMQVDSVKITSI